MLYTLPACILPLVICLALSGVSLQNLHLGSCVLDSAPQHGEHLFLCCHDLYFSDVSMSICPVMYLSRLYSCLPPSDCWDDSSTFSDLKTNKLRLTELILLGFDFFFSLQCASLHCHHEFFFCLVSSCGVRQHPGAEGTLG